MAKITFVVSGVQNSGLSRGGEAPADASTPGRVKQSVRVTTRLAAGGDMRLEAIPGEDVVVLHVANGPSLWLHPETAQELLAAQDDPASRSAGNTAMAPGEVRVPVRLQWRGEQAMPTRGLSRGFLGDVLVGGIDIVTDLVTDKAADFVASKVVQGFDGRVAEGVFKLSVDQLLPLKGTSMSDIPASNQPVLVLIHGTFSDTCGTFKKLWTEYPAKVRELFTAHDGGVFGLDHATLGRHPVSNALTLARALPTGARLRLLTHSRGGLVAEVLARAAAMQPEPLSLIDDWPPDEVTDLRALVTMLRDKKVTIERVVRVACPARGTLLASKRLDAYVSGVKWALQLAGVPIAPELVSFLGEVARRRAEPNMLPGLAAQIPDSPLVQWLHTTETRLPGDLRVVAGDIQGDSIVSWMKTLVSDAFFWTDNDLVVQTRSMYGSTPREANSLFVLDRGSQVSHFNYFANVETATAVVDGLTATTPVGFKVIGPLSWAGTSATGERASTVQRSTAEAAALPALILLPGILGSNLKAGNDRVWLGWRLANGFQRLAFDPASPDTVTADGPLDSFYENLISFMSSDHDVSSCAFDWRRPIEEEATLLADLVEKALDVRKTTGKPVQLIAHSMGGLVARTMQIVRPDIWKRMMDVPGARLLMLGTPNGGSFAPMQMLSGDDTFGNLLTMVGAPFRGYETRQLIAQFPGLLQLQADLLNGLDQEAGWQKLADDDLASLEKASFWHRLTLQLKQAQWGIPRQRVLDAAVALRKKLDAQVANDLPLFADRVLLVVGKAAFTPAGYQLTSDGLVYLGSPDQGDGRVTLPNALLPGVRTWTLDCEHGSLPKKLDAFEAYRDLLATGKTSRLAPLERAAGSRGAAASTALVRSRPSRAIFATTAPPEQSSDVLEVPDSAAGSSSAAAPESGFNITVVNGDLTYVAEPLILGHYQSSRLTGAEAVMDRAIDGAMSASLLRGRYPEAAGECQVFLNLRQSPDNPWQLPRPQAVIVAGLGAENELRGTDLIGTVRQALIAWAQRLTELPAPPTVFKVATTLIGSGGPGISAGQAAQLIAQAVREANVRIGRDKNGEPGWPRVGELRIIELYHSRASEAWQSLRSLAESVPAFYKVNPAIETGLGRLPRPPEAGYRGVDYDFISALVQRDEAQKERIVYNIDTKRARSEVRAQSTQMPLVRALVKQASNGANQDAQIGRTLFSLLVPVDLEPFMASSSATVLELDRGTAPIPWELLDSSVPGSADDRPWAIRTKLLRKLRTGAAPQGVRDASADDNVLIIGDPACDRTVYPKLFGARREANAVEACLRNATMEQNFGPQLKSLISRIDETGTEPSMQEVLNAAMAGPYRIIHIAGHGEPPIEKDGNFTTRGVVLSDDSFLGPDEIRSLRFAPELVFVNCCHLASGGSAALQVTDYDRAAFASGVSEALIAAGVRCVIAAGWAVDDAAAEVFAQTFYTELLAGFTFIDAVAAAREAARSKGGNTWAAYQCYGDPDWRYRQSVGEAQPVVTPPLAQEFAGIGSATALRLALETMAVQSEFQGADATKQAQRLRYLETATEQFWQNSGESAEAFGNAWAKAGRMPEAIKWYERARVMLDGTASLAAVEQLANLKVRQAWKNVSSNLKDPAARDKSRAEIADAMRLLDNLLAIGPTIERMSLYGSAYKRLALIEGSADNKGEEARAIEQVKVYYGAAEKIALKALETDPSAPVNSFYPAMNRLAAEIADDGAQAAVDPGLVEAIRKSMATAPTDFYSVVGQTEVSIYVSILGRTLAKDVKKLVKEFTQHHERVSAAKMWGSVYDNATFVLAKYRQRARDVERVAVGELLLALAKFAGQPAPVFDEGAPSTAKPEGQTFSSKRKTASETPAKARKPRRKKGG
jgi:tetratricopeptide (TPR) repeat protein/pimeloyl-ACP methyl ester carboxylesterase